MLELLAKLGDTPVPNVLVIAGIVFLLLAVAGHIGANLSVPPRRQAAAAGIGAALLISGIAIFVAPSPQRLSAQPTSLSGRPQTKPEEDSAGRLSVQPRPSPTMLAGNAGDERTVRTAVEAAVANASLQEARARYWLDATILEGVAESGYLRSIVAEVENKKRNQEFDECRIESRDIHDFAVDPNGNRATVDMTESWNCAAYSVRTGDCLAQYSAPHAARQTVLLQRRTAGWVITDVAFPNPGTAVDYVTCKDWPSKNKR